MRIERSAVLIDEANPLAKHVRHRLGVGRGLHNDRRRRLNVSSAGVERGYRPNPNCAGGDLRWRALKLARVSNNRSICYGLPERQRRNHRANKDNSYSSHGVPFIELTFRGCFVRRAFFGCLMGRVRVLAGNIQTLPRRLNRHFRPLLARLDPFHVEIHSSAPTKS